MKSYDDMKALIEQRGVHAEFGAVGEGFAIEQSPHELAVFLVRMQELGVQSVLEIGTGYKGGLSRFLAVDMGWKVLTIDIKDYGHTFEGVHYIVYDHWQDTVSITNKSIDLVFIDGAHDYDSVHSDYITYGRAARKVIAFHDVAGLRQCEGVMQLWGEIYRSGDYSTEFIHWIVAESQCAGIGWIEL